MTAVEFKAPEGDKPVVEARAALAAGLNRDELLGLYRTMLLIRRFEEKAEEMYGRQKIGGFLHIYIGEEAVAVGAISMLRKEDYVVTHYRDHGHALAKGCDPKAVMAELFGKATGVSRGKGGSMHIFCKDQGMMGGYAIVSGGMPIGVGLGLASQYLGEDRVTLNVFGDGAVDEGEFHESLDLAALWKLPVIFLCENNFYSMGTALQRKSPVKDIVTRACGYGVPARAVDGMDVLVVRAAVAEAVERARAGEGPTLIEAKTYRFRGHSMADPGRYRPKQEEEIWRARDPIPSFAFCLKESGFATDEDFRAMEAEVMSVVEESVRFAEESPFLPLAGLYQDVYA